MRAACFFALMGLWLSTVLSAAEPVKADSTAAPAKMGDAAPQKADAHRAGLDFFENKVRPVLVKHCYECHSREKNARKGGLLLDSREGWSVGGDSGPAVVPGKPTESLLIQAVRHDGLQMPPTEKLPESVLADLEQWVKLGAPDPRDGKLTPTKPTLDLEAARKHWAFQPIADSAVPTVKDAAWPRTNVDRYVLAALEARGLRPSRDAERAVLLRRVHLDVIGLPPSPEELAAFLADPADDATALAAVVDRLLASSAFGERWGRHWLDVARYADSNGKDENLTFHVAWRYRDYVIASFNADKPFDQFVREQIAGDLMSANSAEQADTQLVATGFLVVGPKVLADRDKAKRKMDVVDEQIDTVGRAFLGMTLGCARCHDHKFDPVPTADYYALAGIFASTRTLDGFKLGNPIVSGWMERPLGGAEGARRLAAQAEHKKKLVAVEADIKKLRAELKGYEDQATMRVAPLIAGVTVDTPAAKLTGTWKPSQYTRPYVGDGYIHDDKAGKGEKSASFTAELATGEFEVQLSYTVGGNRATAVPVSIRHADGEAAVKLDQSKKPSVDELFQPVGRYRFEAGKPAVVVISNAGTEGYVIVDAVRFVPVGKPPEKPAKDAAKAAAKAAPKAPAEKTSKKSADKPEASPATALGVPMEVTDKIAAATDRLKKLEAELAELKKSAPPAAEMVMAVRDDDAIANARINVRGNPAQLGAEVPRGFLSVVTPLIAGTPSALPAKQSGRLELATWLSSPSNPLTPRVTVNRVWAHLFGFGLVRSVDNFGLPGERPSHPELLDALAGQFVRDGWSVKKLIRTLVLSRVYAQAVGDGRSPEAAAAAADPENRLLWRANRRRVEAEVLRDSVLAVAGTLDRSAGGSSVAGLGERAIDKDSKGGLDSEGTTRRSVYLPIIRSDLPALFEVFDFADPDVSVGQRDATTVATQSLYLMNSRFVMEQSRRTAERLMKASSDPTARVTELYRLAFSRVPSPAEVARVTAFVSSYQKQPSRAAKATPADRELEAWTAVCLAVFGSTEFRFVE